MTLEELKKAADELGYSLIKKEPYERFLPCTCGCNKRSHWVIWDDSDSKYRYYYECYNCGKEGPRGKSPTDARRLWNTMIRKEMKNGD